MDRELLEQHHEGIIALSGCPSGEVHRAASSTAASTRRVKVAALVPGGLRDDYYLEVQEHGITEHEPLDARASSDLAEETGIPARRDQRLHYVEHRRRPLPGRPALHRHQRHGAAGRPHEDVRRRRLLLPEVRGRDARALPRAPGGDRQHRSASPRCATSSSSSAALQPARRRTCPPASPPTSTSRASAAKACAALSRRRRTSRATACDYELDVVEQTGFADYILIVARLRAASPASSGILMGVRGSAAASIILYCLGVTDIDPLEHRLVFERFLNLERREMPDVDFDFADDRRDEVIRYVAENYGHDRVAQIITFGTLGAKASIRDVGRALGMSYADVDRVARLVPERRSHMTLDQALEREQRAAAGSTRPTQRARSSIDTAQRARGRRAPRQHPRRRRRHRAEPLVEHLPAAAPGARRAQTRCRRRSSRWSTSRSIGLLKMDFLGLSNLTILGKAVELIKETRGDRHRPRSTCRTATRRPSRCSARGETFGVFQLESAGMRRYVQELKPDVDRGPRGDGRALPPGPDAAHPAPTCRAKHGLEEIRYPHPDLAEILDETYGVIVYQDQVLLIAQKFAGYSLGAGRHHAQGDGQEDRRDDARGGASASSPAPSRRATRRRTPSRSST